jgi:hypothetical protein
MVNSVPVGLDAVRAARTLTGSLPLCCCRSGACVAVWSCACVLRSVGRAHAARWRARGWRGEPVRQPGRCGARRLTGCRRPVCRRWRLLHAVRPNGGPPAQWGGVQVEEVWNERRGATRGESARARLSHCPLRGAAAARRHNTVDAGGAQGSNGRDAGPSAIDGAAELRRLSRGWWRRELQGREQSKRGGKGLKAPPTHTVCFAIRQGAPPMQLAVCEGSLAQAYWTATATPWRAETGARAGGWAGLLVSAILCHKAECTNADASLVGSKWIKTAHVGPLPRAARRWSIQATCYGAVRLYLL